MSNFPDFKAYCHDACIKLWGEPDKRTKKELRWNGGDAYSARTFDLRKRVWFDAGAQRGGSTLQLVSYVKGEPASELKGAAFFATWAEAHKMQLVPDPPPPPKKGRGDLPIRAAYPYRNEQGTLLFEVVRFDTEDPDERFRQRQPDGRGDWIWHIKGVRRVLYRLPELIAAVDAKQRVLVCEGEKDANTAAKLGYAATCNPMGVGKWRQQYAMFFAGADVIVVSDNDAQLKDKKTGAPLFHPDGRPRLPGQDHAAAVAQSLIGMAARVRVIMFDVKDLTEWAAAGGARQQLDALIEATPDYTPKPPPEPATDEVEPSDADVEIARLAKLSAVEYEHQRKAAAEKLDVRASILDKLVAAERAKLGLDGDDDKQGRAIEFPTPEAWPALVDGAALLDEIATAVRGHVVLDDHSRDASALWAVHTYVIKRFAISPKLFVRSALRGCGKSTLLDALGHVVARPMLAANITTATAFRLIAKYQPTLLIDEVDSFLRDNEELRGILNASHRHDGHVPRLVGDDHEPRNFPVYTAVALAGIGSLHSTLMDRSIVIELQRRKMSEPVNSLRIGKTEHLDRLVRKILSTSLAELLADIEDRPWAEYGRSEKPITTHKIGRLLRPLGIIAERIDIEQLQDDGQMATVRVRGYKRERFEEAFERFLPPEGDVKASKCPKRDEQGTSEIFKVSENSSERTLQKSQKSNNDGLLDTWTLREGGGGEKATVGANGGGEPGLSTRRVRELADWYADQGHQRHSEGTLDTPALDDELRAILRKEGVFPEFVEVEFERVMDVVFKV
jgi:hypothetical protein